MILLKIIKGWVADRAFVDAMVFGFFVGFASESVTWGFVAAWGLLVVLGRIEENDREAR